MGCKGSKVAEAPKSEAASATLLAKPEEPKGDLPMAEGSATEPTTEEVAADATAEKAAETPNEAPADASAATAQETVESQEAPKPTPDATTTKAEEVKTEEPATDVATTQETVESQEAPKPTLDATTTKAEDVKTVYNPEWNPTGIEGGVDTNKLPWIEFPGVQGWFYKPLRASKENGMFSIVAKMTKGTVQPDLIHLGSVDFMVLSGKMTFQSGPMKGSLEEGVWAYIPAEALITGLKADSDVEYVMNCYGPFAFLNSDKSVKSLFTSSDVQAAARHRGITLIPNTLAECMEERPAGYSGKGEPLAIAQKTNSDLLMRAKEVASNADAMNCVHYVDTKALKWFESMPGVGLKILRVSEETGVVTVMVRHNAAAPPHYHLGCADFFMLQGHLGYRAGPPEGYGPGTWFFEPAGARHESTQPVTESEDTVYLANVYGPIQFDSGVGTPIAFVFSWMSYLGMAEANGFPLVRNKFPNDSSHLAVTKADIAPRPTEQVSVYNPEWNPTGIEGGVDTNKLPWIEFPGAKGWSYKPLRASGENGMFSVVCRLIAGTQLADFVHLGGCDFMVLSGKMTFPSGPMAGTLQEGTFAFIPADAVISGLRADEDVEYVMNCYGPFALLNKDQSVQELITSNVIQRAAAKRGITLIPGTLAECMQDRPEEYKGMPEPLAISDATKAASLTCEREGATDNAAARKNPHYVDTKALKWFESMPGVGLKILRVSEETGVVTVMVRHNAAAPPHYHLGASDFFMLQGHLGYRAGPPEGYGPGTWFFEPAGARHESTQPVDESEDTVYLAHIYGPIQFDSGVGTDIAFVFSWMSYLQMAEANGFPLVSNRFPDDSAPATEQEAEKVAEADAEGIAELVAVSVDAADATVTAKQGSCFSYCTATEAQTEIVVPVA